MASHSCSLTQREQASQTVNSRRELVSSQSLLVRFDSGRNSSNNLTWIHFIFTLSIRASEGKHHISKFQVVGNSAGTEYLHIYSKHKGPTKNNDPRSLALKDNSRQPWGNHAILSTFHLHLAEWSSMVMADEPLKDHEDYLTEWCIPGGTQLYMAARKRKTTITLLASSKT